MSDELVAEMIRTAQERFGPRVAMICPHEGCQTRNFGDASWVCSTHGVSERQSNRPYFGVPT